MPPRAKVKVDEQEAVEPEASEAATPEEEVQETEEAAEKVVDAGWATDAKIIEADGTERPLIPMEVEEPVVETPEEVVDDGIEVASNEQLDAMAKDSLPVEDVLPVEELSTEEPAVAVPDLVEESFETPVVEPADESHGCDWSAQYDGECECPKEFR